MAEQKEHDDRTGGYDVQFIENNISKDELTCVVCLFILKEPMQSVPCGHRFCKSCTHKMLRDDATLICPIDRQIVQVFPDTGKQREILNLDIKCIHGDSSPCTWIGELRELQKHIGTTCLFHQIKCPNEQCTIQMLRKDLKHHLLYNCQYETHPCVFCRQPVLRADMLVHNRECQLFPMKCEYNCGKAFQRHLMTDHLKSECPKAIHPCEYADIGCPFKGTNDELEVHLKEDVEKHLLKLKTANQELKSKVKQQEEKLSEQEKKQQQQNGAIDNLHEKFNNLKSFINSPKFIKSLT